MKPPVFSKRKKKKSTISAQKITLDAPRLIICKTGLGTKRRLGKSAPFIADVYPFLFYFDFVFYWNPPKIKINKKRITRNRHGSDGMTNKTGRSLCSVCVCVVPRWTFHTGWGFLFCVCVSPPSSDRPSLAIRKKKLFLLLLSERKTGFHHTRCRCVSCNNWTRIPVESQAAGGWPMWWMGENCVDREENI